MQHASLSQHAPFPPIRGSDPRVRLGKRPFEAAKAIGGLGSTPYPSIMCRRGCSHSHTPASPHPLGTTLRQRTTHSRPHWCSSASDSCSQQDNRNSLGRCNVAAASTGDASPAATTPVPHRHDSSTANSHETSIHHGEHTTAASASGHNGNGHSAAHSHAQSHPQHHHHGHSHAHGHEHVHSDNWISRALGAVGLIELGEVMEHSWACTATSIACFILALLTSFSPLLDALGNFATSGSAAGGLAGAVKAFLVAAPTVSAIALGVTFVMSGIPQSVEALSIAGSGTLDTHVLMLLAVLGTLYMGLAQEGALLLLLFQVSHFLEHKLTARAEGNMERLFSGIPSTATIVDFDPQHSGNGASTSSSNGSGGGGGAFLGSARSQRADSVQLGQYVLVKPGEQVPLDGEVVYGSANVSLSHISGESQPVRMAPGSLAPAGSLNTDGLLVLRVTALSDDSTPARIARMTAEARSARPKLARQIDSIGSTWSKAVVAATLATLAILPFFGVPLLAPRGALYRAMAVLTAGSPCAVALVPLAYVCAIAAVTRKGVLIKSAAALEELAACTVVALDKTGTITSGVLSLTEAFILSPATDSSKSGVQQALPLHHRQANQPASRLVKPNLRRTSSNVSAVSNFSAGSSVTASSTLSTRSSSPVSSISSSPGSQRLERSSSLESDDSLDISGSKAPHVTDVGFETLAIQYAVALSRASTHPVSRAMDEYGSASTQHVGDVHVSGFEQVPGAGVQGTCNAAGAASSFVRFGSLEFILEHVTEPALRYLLTQAANSHSSGASKALSFLSLSSHPRNPHATTTATHSNAASSISSPSASPTTATSYSQGGAPSFSQAVQHQQVAMFCFEDAVPPGVAPAVALLQSGRWRGVGANSAARSGDVKQLVMLTGDNERVAAQVAGAVDIAHYRAALKPEDKLQYVRSYAPDTTVTAAPATTATVISSQTADKTSSTSNSDSRRQGGLVMVGDGINDAPALAAARVGIAIASTPSDLVASAADVIILNGQGVANLPWLFRIAARTHSIVQQNLALALVSVLFATLPTVAGFFPLWLAVLLHEGSTLAVALNSLRLLMDPHPAAGTGLFDGLTSAWNGIADLWRGDEEDVQRGISKGRGAAGKSVDADQQHFGAEGKGQQAGLLGAAAPA